MREDNEMNKPSSSVAYIAAPIIDSDRARMASVIEVGDSPLKVLTADEISKVVGFAVSSTHGKRVD